MVEINDESFDFGYTWTDGPDDVVSVYHFEVHPDRRGEGIGTVALETLKRVFHYEGADRMEVRMGGGEAAEAFLRDRDFEIVEREDRTGEGWENIDYDYAPVGIYDYTGREDFERSVSEDSSGSGAKEES